MMRVRKNPFFVVSHKSSARHNTVLYFIFYINIFLQAHQILVLGDPLDPINNNNGNPNTEQLHSDEQSEVRHFSSPSSSSLAVPVTTTATPAVANYNCPAGCECVYRGVPKQLEITCGQGESGGSSGDVISITYGIRQLAFKGVTLKRKTLRSMLPPIGKDVLRIIQVQDSLLDPTPFFNSEIIRHSQDSLSRIEIRNSVFSSDEAVPSPAGHFYESALPHLSRLRALDSLIVCDSSPPLASLVLQSLPPSVNHITLTNSSLADLDPAYFARSHSLQTLNLSFNEIGSIPARLTEHLTDLTVLDLSHNRIQHLQEQVFRGLGRLRKLYLSHNQIRYVDTDVFNPLSDIEEIDLSFNNVIQFFEPYFLINPNLRTLNMKRTWTAKTFIDPETGVRSRMEMERLINTLQSIQSLDISDNDMLIIPETLTHPSLNRVSLAGNRWKCSCEDRWFLYWLDTSNVSISSSSASTGYSRELSDLYCHNGTHRYPLKQYLEGLHCTNRNIYSKVPNKYYTHMGLSPLLSCHRQGTSWPIVSWLTPQKKKLGYSKPGSIYSASLSAGANSYEDDDEANRLRVLENGTLLVSNFTQSDFGLYICVAQYQDLNITHYVHVGVDTSIFSDVRIMSFIWGWTVSFAFVLLVVIVNAIKALLKMCGVECSTMGKSYQARHLRKFFESVEHHKTTQLDWLRDNYNMQARKIKDNCILQLERIRDSYAVQHKNLSDIRDYGTNQLHGLRDQYYDQIRRVSTYSAHQLCKVRENYLFQRNRVCKFSSHQLIRLRETYKWQAQTLNKILENLPTLNLDTCRGISTCGRTDSLYMEDMSEFQSLDSDSVYAPGRGDLSRTDDGFAIEKLEHVSLLIPPEFLLPPDYLTQALHETEVEATVEKPPPLAQEEDHEDLNANC